jgi:hypothetical protein
MHRRIVTFTALAFFISCTSQRDPVPEGVNTGGPSGVGSGGSTAPVTGSGGSSGADQPNDGSAGAPDMGPPPSQNATIEPLPETTFVFYRFESGANPAHVHLWARDAISGNERLISRLDDAFGSLRTKGGDRLTILARPEMDSVLRTVPVRRRRRRPGGPHHDGLGRSAPTASSSSG